MSAPAARAPSATRSNRPASVAKRRPGSATLMRDGESQADRRPRDSSSVSAARGPRPDATGQSKARTGPKRVALKKLPGQIPGAGGVLYGPVNKADILQGGTRVRKAAPDDPNRPARDAAIVAVVKGPHGVEDARAEAEAADPGCFVAAEKFNGARAGFTFRTAWLGTGYYRDATQIQSERHNARVEELKREHKQKVESLMRSIHKLQDKTKDLRRADKENRRSKLIIDLQNTVGEQEAVIRAMIRSLTGFGFSDAQFSEVFSGKKNLRDVDALETGLRQAERAKEAAQRKLKASESRYEQAKGTREQLKSEFEEQVIMWKSRACSAEEINKSLDHALAEAEASHAREQQATRDMEQMRAEMETLRVNTKAWEEERLQNEALLAQLSATIKDNEEKLAEQSQKGRQMRAALKAQEKQILAAATGGGVIQLPAASHNRADSARAGTVSREDHERELERVRRALLSEQQALRESHASSLQRLERQWELRFESREAEMEAARQREHSAAAAELEVWKQKANGGRDGGPASNRDASLRQSRSEIVASEAARSHLEAELAKEQAWREGRQAMDLEANTQVSSSASAAGLSRQLAALKLVHKDTARRLETAADDLAVAQVEKASLSSQLAAALQDVTTAEKRVGVLQESTNRALQEQRQLRTSYDRLLAAFGAKCTALQSAQDRSTEAHEHFRKQLSELGSATEGGADAALREDFGKQLAENKAIIDDLRSDIDEHQVLAKQANADQLQLLHRNSHSAGAVSDPPQPASASDPSIAFLQPADFILTSSDLVEAAHGRDAPHGAPTSTSLAEDLNRNTQFRAGLDDLLVE